ncbi:Serine/threonine protein kinase [Rhodococcus wratislaviensis]|uniref:non-specific serine/threonine protein kinase n=2 Tax=Nocardiaceae TaxID=85025 RepID=A0A402CJ01_RHOWR|nr:Serine/threonine protein kinase [Rhodococcus wratislaviensis]
MWWLVRKGGGDIRSDLTRTNYSCTPEMSEAVFRDGQGGCVGMSEHDLVPGAMFAGFTIERVLGTGGMGTVYLARHGSLPRGVAVKVLDGTADDYMRARFVREAEHTARLEHPNIVTVYDRGCEGDRLWIAMQYVAGTDAATLLRRGPLPPDLAVHIVAEIGQALDFAHEHGILHRDVKPANVLLAGRPAAGAGVWRVLLTDFGIAKNLDETRRLTRTGMLVATLVYAAPEALVAGVEPDHRADVYSLGCMLFQLLTGRLPYSGSAAAVVDAHLNQPIPRPTVLRPSLPDAMDPVIRQALAKDRDTRFDSCGALAQAARRALSSPRPAPGPRETRTPQMPPVPDRIRAPSPPRQVRAATPLRRVRIDTPPLNRGVEGAGRPGGTRAGGQPGPVRWWRRTTTIVVGVLAAMVVVGAGVGAVAAYLASPHPPAARTQTTLAFAGLASPQGVAVDANGTVFVADSKNNRVLELASGVTTQTVLPFSGLDDPLAVAVDARGNVYVADTGNNRVLELVAGSATPTTLPFSGLDEPLGVSVSDGGDVYVADGGNNRVLKLVAGSSTPTVLPFTGLSRPTDVTVSDTGDVVVPDSRNHRVLELTAGASTPATLPFNDGHAPNAVAVSDAGDVLLTTLDSNDVFELESGSSAPTTLPFTGLDRPAGIAAGDDGHLYLSDLGNNRVLELA